MTADGLDTLRITFKMPEGQTGCDDDPSNPISRALTSLMKDHTLLPTFTQAFLIDETAGEPWRWLGVFVKSAGERILFFPGFKTEMTHVRGFRGEELKFDRPFAFDHASLEQRRDTWHITTARSKDHEGRPAATDLGDGRVLWFGMSLASTDVLRELKRDTVATFAVPERSSKWKGEQFIQSRQGKEFPGVYLPERPGTAEDLCFPLISVIVGPTGFEIYRGPIWGWPYGSVFATEEPSEQVRFRTRHQRFRLDEQTDVQLTAMWGLGSLAIPAIFTSPIVRAIEPNADS